ncbi:MAG: hypothetical protein MUE72_03485 [Chitinophagaceae bacterium]|nr:hypothetical protein [Chitinophagaceae bacterium]
MSRDEIIATVSMMINNYSSNSEIEDYLRSEKIGDENFTSIIEEAQAHLISEKKILFGKKHKLLFAMWIAFTIAALILFFFILPLWDGTGSIKLLSILGVLLICSFTYFSFVYYKTWEPSFIEQYETPKIIMSSWLFFMIFGILLYPLLSWRFSNAADSILKKTQQKTIGIVVSGTSVTSRKGLDFTYIDVEFETKEGVHVTATEDISKYDFKKFYIGQKINLIYSKDNPQNIDLLINESSVIEFTGSAEREITPTDLISFLSIKKENIQSELEKIKYGWQFNEKKKVWVNEKNNSYLSIADGGIVFMSKSTILYTYPKQLEAMGFKRIMGNTKNSPEVEALGLAPKLFQNETYQVILQQEKNDESIHALVIITKLTK